MFSTTCCTIHNDFKTSVERAIDYLSKNARRAHPKRDQKTGRLKLGLVHINVGA